MIRTVPILSTCIAALFLAGCAGSADRQNAAGSIAPGQGERVNISLSGTFSTPVAVANGGSVRKDARGQSHFITGPLTTADAYWCALGQYAALDPSSYPATDSYKFMGVLSGVRLGDESIAGSVAIFDPSNVATHLDLINFSDISGTIAVPGVPSEKTIAQAQVSCSA